MLFFWRRKPEVEPEVVAPPPSPPVKKGRAQPGDRLLRPPGALPEPGLLAACTRCGDCVDACQVNAIFLLPEAFGALAGSPAIAPRKFPCYSKADTPCITACKTGALTAGPIRLGTAAVDPARCVTYHGESCDRCVSMCPVPGALVSDGGRPRVDATLCTGCGLCEHVCPTDEAAITVTPARLLSG